MPFVGQVNLVIQEGCSGSSVSFHSSQQEREGRGQRDASSLKGQVAEDSYATLTFIEERGDTEIGGQLAASGTWDFYEDIPSRMMGL